MIEIYCAHCGDRVEIGDAQEIGGSVQIKIIPCGCPDVPCDLKTCEHIKDFQEQIKKKDETISAFNTIIENIKKATEGDG